jgi:D-sedoheptulose 7-phosphate isomerase
MENEDLLHIRRYFERKIEVINEMNFSSIVKLIETIRELSFSKKTVYLAGNGGSASTASHFSIDLGVGSLRRGKPVKAVSLCDNSGVITATANDLSFTTVFEQQLYLFGEPGDLLILFSASGNSANILQACRSALHMGLNVFSMTGFDGGVLRDETIESNIHVPTEVGEYGIVEDVHLAICHSITECVRR